MTTNKKEIKVSIIAGPNEEQLKISLTRACQGPYGVSMDKANSVQFITNGKDSIMSSGFSACLEGMSQVDGSENSWIIEGYILGHTNISGFNGYYNSNTRKGNLTLTLL